MNVSIQNMSIGPTFVRVHWQVPVFRGIPRVSRYEITVTQADHRADLLTFYDIDETVDFNVTGLVPATRYEFRVVAISEMVGRSPASDPVFANTTTTGMCVQCWLALHGKIFMHFVHKDICERSYYVCRATNE